MDREFTLNFCSHNTQSRIKYPTNTIGRFKCELPVGRSALQGWLMSVLKVTMLTNVKPKFMFGFELDDFRFELDAYQVTDADAMVKFDRLLLAHPAFDGKVRIVKQQTTPTVKWALFAPRLEGNQRHYFGCDRAFAAMVGWDLDQWAPNTKGPFNEYMVFSSVKVDKARPSRICALHCDLAAMPGGTPGSARFPRQVETFILPDYTEKKKKPQPFFVHEPVTPSWTKVSGRGGDPTIEFSLRTIDEEKRDFDFNNPVPDQFKGNGLIVTVAFSPPVSTPDTDMF